MTTLRLPEFEERPSLGGRLVHRTVSLTLVSLGLLGAAAAAVLFLVRVEITVEASGALEPLEIRRVSTTASGVVREVTVRSGDPVEAGEVLARLDGFETSRELERLRLEARFKSYRPETPRSETELLEQRIRLLEERLERLELRSPAAGTVLSEELDQLVGTWVGEGQVIFEIGSADKWKAVLRVAEREIDPIRVGDPVKVRVPAVDDPTTWMPENLPARVTFVGSELLEASAPGRGFYRVYAELTSAAVSLERRRRFRRGMTVEARVVTRSARAIDLLVHHFKRQAGIDG